MPDRRDPPPTEEGWYALHDFRTIDWDAWRDAPVRTRERALSEAVDHLEARLAVSDADEGASALYSVLGHDADLLLIHLRPTTAHIDALQRQFERTAFAEFTERTRSFVSVTEASGYSERAREYFEGDGESDSGLASYIHTRLEPSIPDATHVSFYPMDKRRQPGQNWYDLPFEERAEHMAAHGDIGRDYGGRVVQMITGAIALDDWEWGVTLWGDDLTDIKDLLYEMRFDPSTSKFAEFGSFYVGRRFSPGDLPALLAGEVVPANGESAPNIDRAVAPTDVDPGATAEPAGDAGRAVEADTDAGDAGTTAGTDAGDAGTTAGTDAGDAGTTAGTDAGDADTAVGTDAGGAGTTAGTDTGGAGTTAGTDAGGRDTGGIAPAPEVSGEVETIEDDAMPGRLATLGFREGEDYDPGAHGLVVYSTADAKELAEEVDSLRGNFEHYDTHVTTTVRATQGRSAVVSVWETERAAGIAEGFLTDLSEVSRSVSGPLGDAEPDDDGNATDSPDSESHTADTSPDIREALADLDIYAGQPHGEDIYALVLYSTADLGRLREAAGDLANGFDRYDTHGGTAVYDDGNSDRAAVVSLWDTQDAANTASEHLTDLPGVVGWADESDGFSTMGMFYTVEPTHREEFVETFAEVGELLDGMDGHRETSLLVNADDENDMFIASRWDERDDAMDFFGSDAFADVVDWGREVLADRPRHVFLA
jgi:chlorite dismutase/heme-degrading monooxygenase HmoA